MVSTKLFYAAAIVSCLVAASHCQNYLDEEDEYQVRPQPHRSSGGFSRPSAPLASSGPKPTPVPILKQINRHNEDGSYTYGYEGADGSFKIETKLNTGEVMGKYGYVDDNGKVRVVEYGANKYGFMPAGEGITVAPPTLVDETTDKNGRRIVQDYDEPQQAPAPKYRPAPKHAPRAQHQEFEEYQEEPRYQQPVQHFAPAPRPAPVFAPAPRPAPRPVPQQQSRPVQHSFPSAAPVPSRATIPGAAPADNFGPAPVYEQPRPAPARLPPPPPQQVYRPQPQQQQVFRPQPQEQRGGRSGGILDQLAKDYALPQGDSRFTHDITFSSY